MADQDSSPSPERTRYRIPTDGEIEHQPWGDSLEDYNRFSRSRIPRPMPSQSIAEESGGYYLQPGGGGGRLERSVTDSYIPMRDSPERTPVMSLERSNTEGPRTARYQQGKFSSYEEMLAQMDTEDPFNADAPPPKELKRENTRERSFLRANQDRKMSPTKENSFIRPPKTRGRSDGAKELEGTYSVSTHKNPVYNGGVKPGSDKIPKPTKNSKSSRGTGAALKVRLTGNRGTKQRPVSATSTGTYTVDLERSDSHSKLINKKDVHVKTPAIMTQSKKVRIDCRDDKTNIVQEYIADDIREYIKGHIKNRECKIYIRNAKKENFCQCGRDYEWHHAENLPVAENKKESWKSDKHTKTIDPESFGVVRFVGFGKEAQLGAPYVRVDSQNIERNVEKIWTLLDKHWKMSPPKLIISVTGGAQRFFMKNRLMTSFKRGLVNLATTTGAWIITGGTNTGVMKFVGEAVKDYMQTTGGSQQKVVALGIATWGVVDNKDALTDEENCAGLFPAEYNADELSPKGVRGVSSLDPNHTHFILVDDGTEKKFGAEIKFRVAFEQYISEKMETGVTRNQSVHVPVVQLVLEGGENTLKTALEGLKSNTPAVIIQGSGRAADYIAFAYNSTKSKDSDDKTKFPPGFEQSLYAKAETVFDWTREKDPEEKKKKIKTCVENVKKLLDYRRLVTVFHLDDVDTTNEIDQAVLYALLKANKADAQTQLNLALAWNRCDIARQEIFTIENRSNWQKVDLYEAMFTALIQDRIDFVQLFMDCGVDLRKFLTTYNLRELYDDVIHDKYAGSSKDLLLHLLQDTHSAFSAVSCCRSDPWREDSPYLLKHVGAAIDNLMGDQEQNLYREDRYVVNEKPGFLSARMSTNKIADNGLAFTNKSFSGDNLETARSLGGTMRRRKTKTVWMPDFPDPERHLFIWSILLNRKELSLLFWKNGKDHIASALVGCYLLKSLAGEAENEEETDLANELLANANELELIAVGLLNECYQRDKAQAHRLLTREHEEWGGTTLFSIAEAAQCMEFLGHSCCQTRLNKIWKGQMALYTSTWKVLLCLFFPIFLPAIKFSGVEFGAETAAIAVKPADSHQNQVVPQEGDEHFQRSNTRRKNSKKDKWKKKMYTVHLCNCGFDDKINIFQALYYYHNSPLVKFCFHTLSYVVYLGLFSFFVLTDLHPLDEEDASIDIVEYIVWAWAVTLLMEEVRQVLRSRGTFRTKMKEYFSSTLNRFDLCAYSMLLLSIILRFSLTQNDFVWARMFYALTVMMFFIKFLYQFFVAKNIGPKVIMISKMLTDLSFFVMILLVFVFAYGVARHALQFPNSPLSWNILQDVVFQPYWNIYGELFFDGEQIEGQTCSSNRTMYTDPSFGLPRCAENSWLASILFAVYMVITNVLLLNLLIAMFSYTFERVQENSEKVWRYYRHGLVYEYFDKPTFAPPLIIISHMWRLVHYIYVMCVKKGEFKNHHFHHKLSVDENSRLTSFVRAAMEKYQIQQNILNQEHIIYKVTNTSERIDHVIENLDQIKESLISGETALASITESKPDPASPNGGQVLPSARYDTKDEFIEVHQRIAGLEDRLNVQQETMDQMCIMMQELVSAARHPRGRYVVSQPQPQIEIQDFNSTT